MTSILSRRRSGIFSFGANPSEPSEVFREIAVKKDEKGYGFQVSGECPAHVVKVRHGSFAQANGLEANDIVIKIDSENVVNAPHEKIVTLIRGRDSFNMTVQKQKSASKHQKMPSQPIVLSDEIARVGGYDITCNMITSEYKRLMAFRRQLLEEETLTEGDKATLKSMMNTSQQIIHNLQKKVPVSYVEKMKTELNIPDDVVRQESFTDEFTPPQIDCQRLNTVDGRPSSFVEPQSPAVKVKRRSSANDRISRTHSIAQDVLANFRSLRKQQAPNRLGNYSSQFGSLQNLAAKDIQDNRKLTRKNTISDSSHRQFACSSSNH